MELGESTYRDASGHTNQVYFPAIAEDQRGLTEDERKKEEDDGIGNAEGEEGAAICTPRAVG